MGIHVAARTTARFKTNVPIAVQCSICYNEVNQERGYGPMFLM